MQKKGTNKQTEVNQVLAKLFLLFPAWPETFCVLLLMIGTQFKITRHSRKQFNTI